MRATGQAEDDERQMAAMSADDRKKFKQRQRKEAQRAAKESEERQKAAESAANAAATAAAGKERDAKDKGAAKKAAAPKKCAYMSLCLGLSSCPGCTRHADCGAAGRGNNVQHHNVGLWLLARNSMQTWQPDIAMVSPREKRGRQTRSSRKCTCNVEGCLPQAGPRP